jgi:hypothetical protein
MKFYTFIFLSLISFIRSNGQDLTHCNRKKIEIKFTLDSFKTLDLNALIEKNEYEFDDDIKYNLSVMNYGKILQTFSVNIENNLPGSGQTFFTTYKTDSSNTPKVFYNYELVNSLDKNKTKSLSTCRINYKEHDSLVRKKSITLDGYILGLDSNNLKFHTTSENIDIEFRNGIHSIVRNEFDHSSVRLNLAEKSIALNNLESITTYGNDFLRGIGGLIFGSSCISALL